MPGFENMPGWVTGGGAGVLLYLSIKYFWPSIRDSLYGQAQQWRSENRYIAQLEKSLNNALTERDKAVHEKNELYQRFATMEAKMQVMEFKLDLAQQEVEKLTNEIQKLTRGLNASDHQRT